MGKMPESQLEMNFSDSLKLMTRAKKAVPGGVSSYARKFETPICFQSGKGAKVWDLDGNEYVDYLQAWGAIVLGHSHEAVNEKVTSTLAKQDLYGMGTTELEVEVAEMIKAHIPSAENVLFGVTGSEVVARAITLSRAVTGRSKVVKFQGHYHGWYDSVAMNHLSNEDDLGGKDVFSEGLIPGSANETLVLPFNDIEAIEGVVEEEGDEIACIILEPIAHNMGCVLPEQGYLRALRELADTYGIVLIFDEIITGFRHDMGGIQKLEGVTPDLSTLGKSVANGYPMSVLCGKEKYMTHFHTTDDGEVAFGGTYNAHAGALAAAKETMYRLEKYDFHKRSRSHCERICNGLDDIIEDLGLQAHVSSYGSVFLTYFADPPMKNYNDVLRNDVTRYMEYRWRMIDQGVLMVPKNARRNYLTASHSDEDIVKTIEAAEEALSAVG